MHFYQLILFLCIAIIVRKDEVAAISSESESTSVVVSALDFSLFNETEYADRIVAVINRGDCHVLHDMVFSGIDVNVESSLEVVPLLVAAYNIHLECIKVLVEAAADIDITEGDGWTPLMFVAHAGSFEATQYLIEQGADPFMWNIDEFTAFEIAHSSGHMKVCSVFALMANA